MRIQIVFIVIGAVFANCVHGQSYPNLEKTLAQRFAKDSQEDDRWVFYQEKANIIKIVKPLVKQRTPNYDFYQVTLTNYLGYHINQGTCVVPFDSTSSKIILVTPMWFGGISEPLVKLYIGQRFSDKDSLLSFLTELNELMQIGSFYKFRLTSSSDTLITYDLGYFKGNSITTGGNGTSSTVTYNEDGVWRKIKIEINDLAITTYLEINPVTNEINAINSKNP